MLERDAIQEFHGDEGMSLVLTDVVDGADVGMIQGRGSLRLALEAAQRLQVAHDVVGQELESYETAEARVLGLVHHTHAAAAQLFDHAVVRDGLSNHSGELAGFWGRFILRALGPLVNEMTALTPECQTWDLEMGICREPYRYSQFGLQCNQLPGSKPEMITSDTLCLTVLCEVCERKTAIFRPSNVPL